MTETDKTVEAPAYVYRAISVSVYDGDTITVDIDCGFGVWLRGQKVRLYGIDTPEVRGEEREAGLVARDYVRHLIPTGRPILIRTQKDKTGKYGRWLAEVFVMLPSTPPGSPSICINESLVQRGFARRMVYR
jgi:micrococcal nuclease